MESPLLDAREMDATQALHAYWFQAWAAVMAVNANLSGQLSSLIQSGLVRTAPVGLSIPVVHADAWQETWREVGAC